MIIPKDYSSRLTVRETEHAIKLVKDSFERELSSALNLYRISAPLYVRASSGLNDNLNGVERPVSFDVPDIGETVEIIHSLAKWKRRALAKYGYNKGEGIYTDMNAIRRDEDLDNIHSIYVDQWDWEIIIDKADRDEQFIKEIVRKIYSALKKTEFFLSEIYSRLQRFLPGEITFITAEELEALYPDLTPKEREYEITKKYGAVFLMHIGGALSSGKPHDGRAPDYDDWNLNGDILVYYPVLDCALELSSMGIRVDAVTLAKQLKISGCEERANLPFHKDLLEGKLPQTAGGGIGQSRLCMLMLGKAHIGEVQASIWDSETKAECLAAGIALL